MLIALNLRKNEKGIDGERKTNTFVQKSPICLSTFLNYLKDSFKEH